LSFWFFAVSDGFFTGDAGFFIGPTDFFWISTGFSDNVAIFFATSAPLVCLSSCLAAYTTSYKIENQQFQRVTQITCPWLAKQLYLLWLFLPLHI
jgi:hypothetical protein